MHGRKLLVALSVAAVLAFGLVARADEKKVKESGVPKAALDAVKKKYPKATLKAFSKETEKGEKGETVTYEVSLVDGERKIDVDLSPEGKILAEEEVIERSALPEKVKKGLADSKYGKWDVKKVERIVKEEKEDAPSYELVLTSSDERFEVVFDKDGKITKEEEKNAPKKKAKAKKEEDDDDDDDDD